MPEGICSEPDCARRAKRRGLCRVHSPSARPCRVEGCERPVDSHDLCPMHVKRWRTTGDPGEAESRHRPNGAGHVRPDGYIVTRNRSHPLAAARGYVYVHRAALYDRIGPGRHSCHWCGVSVEWGDADSPLTADHLDWDRRNNTPENLVPSCLACNSKRYETRTDRGEENPTAKLTEPEVHAIRESDEYCRVLADRYHVSESLIVMIKAGKVWGWLEPRSEGM